MEKKLDKNKKRREDKMGIDGQSTRQWHEASANRI